MPRWQLQLKQPMPRYVAFLRGVSPQNANMPELKASFEAAGFTAVKTLLSSGNLVFDSRVATEASIERQAEAAMQATLGRSFYTIVRRVDTLAQMLASDPYAAFAVPPQAKRVVSFTRQPPTPKAPLPITLDGASVLTIIGREVFTAYEPSPKGPVFMLLIEKTFGKDVTTRTWETVRKCAAA
jgi:uncharacterized protein (DUF1697 family)